MLPLWRDLLSRMPLKHGLAVFWYNETKHLCPGWELSYFRLSVFPYLTIIVTANPFAIVPLFNNLPIIKLAKKRKKNDERRDTMVRGMQFSFRHSLLRVHRVSLGWYCPISATIKHVECVASIGQWGPLRIFILHHFMHILLLFLHLKTLNRTMQ